MHHVVGLEVGDDERPGADRLGVRLGAGRRRGAEAVGELRLLDHRRLRADQRAVGIGLRHPEGDLERLLVDRLHVGHVVEIRGLGAAALGMGAVLPGEDRVLGGHRRAVGPERCPGLIFQVMLLRSSEMPPFSSVGISAAMNGHQVALLVEARQRLDHQARRLDVLGAARQERVHDRDRLPVEDVDLAVRPALGLRRRGGRARAAVAPIRMLLSFMISLLLAGCGGRSGHRPLWLIVEVAGGAVPRARAPPAPAHRRSSGRRPSGSGC